MSAQINKRWSIRQNPRGKMDQYQMRDFVISQNLITCPFGHLSEERTAVIDEVYNENAHWKSNSQDRKFIEDMKIGDIIVIPFKGIKPCLLAVIQSDPIYAADTGYYYNTSCPDKIHLSQEPEVGVGGGGGTPFRPVARKIRIISEIIFSDKRKYLDMSSLSILFKNADEIINSFL